MQKPHFLYGVKLLMQSAVPLHRELHVWMRESALQSLVKRLCWFYTHMAIRNSDLK